ncbi:MAG TPA: lipoyl(octanoyl) transferase LipB [Oscillatoriales cyanobacterium M59_W2019_021]|nr:MAG: lipoyl(octanoyl) transferase [Cyanobacteria bacterium J055]HIK30610.1 lipoyl(octanoyl) transferase LipB [Oscillatoriales cyanobacterium M4454_W2019_049]HIK52120.1 lipoyl(octanoyl) transferase LipB [Oscillatoriales cyanobacterium M59_W2019_021]
MIQSKREPHLLYCLSTSSPVPYTVAWAWQQAWVARRRDDPDREDLLLLVEHPPVYTLGQGATRDFLKPQAYQTGWDIHRVERGGEVTHHCPGQLVGYPILNLRRYRQDLHWYLRQLEEVLIRVLEKLGLQGSRIEGLTGVWVEGCKVAAIGIKVSRWISMHGFALNVCPDLTGFGYIIPCGIADRPVGSLAQFRPGITVEDIRPIVAATFADVFDVRLQHADLSHFLPELKKAGEAGGEKPLTTNKPQTPNTK